MIIDRRDIVIVLLVVVVAVQAMVATFLGHELVRAQASGVSRHQAEEVLRVTERVLTVNELCVRLRARGMVGSDDGKVRDPALGPGTGL